MCTMDAKMDAKGDHSLVQNKELYCSIMYDIVLLHMIGHSEVLPNVELNM